MHLAQMKAIDEIEEMVTEAGGRLSFDEFDMGTDGSLVIEATYGADLDYERVMWTMDRHGDLTIW